MQILRDQELNTKEIQKLEKERTFLIREKTLI